MERAELVNEVKAMCKANNANFVDDIRVCNEIIIVITGNENCKDLLDELLTDLDLEHTQPTLGVDGIESYVTL